MGSSTWGPFTPIRPHCEQGPETRVKQRDTERQTEEMDVDIEEPGAGQGTDRNGLQDTKDSAGRPRGRAGNEAQGTQVVLSSCIYHGRGRDGGALRHQCRVLGLGTKAMSPISVHTSPHGPPTPHLGWAWGTGDPSTGAPVSWAKGVPPTMGV